MDAASREYLDMRLRRYSRESQKTALKMGAFVASFSWLTVGLALWIGFDVLDLAVMAAIGSFIVIFAMWTQGLSTVQNTIEFVQDLNREHDEAMARA